MYRFVKSPSHEADISIIDLACAKTHPHNGISIQIAHKSQ